jgi:hypothetical protein
MTVQQVSDLRTPIGEILKSVGSEGVVLESKDLARYAVIPLDDDLIDYLLERSPKFREVCQQIRERMRAGRSHTHEEVKRLLAGE